MSIVKIYRIYCYRAPQMSETGERFSLSPWGKNTPDYQGEDDGGKEYVLPEGYNVALDQSGTPHIYPVGEDFPCTICAGSGGHPAITAVVYPGYITLQKLEAVEIGARIKQARETAGLTQQQLADAIPAPGGRQQASNWEGGRRTPRRETLERIAEVLGTTPGRLMFGE